MIFRRELLQQGNVDSLVLLRHLIRRLVDEILEQDHQTEIDQENQQQQQRKPGALPECRRRLGLDQGRECTEFRRQIRRVENFVVIVHENPVVRSKIHQSEYPRSYNESDRSNCKRAKPPLPPFKRERRTADRTTLLIRAACA